MTPDTQAIVNAISELKTQTNFFREYVLPCLMPIIVPFISVYFGYLMASKSFDRQEKIKIIIRIVNDSNKFMLEMEDLFKTLLAIKNYYWMLTETDPVARALLVPSIYAHCNSMDCKVHSLMFISRLNSEENTIKWTNISQINSLISDFHQMMYMLENRNKLYVELKEIISKKTGGDFYSSSRLSRDEFIKSIDNVFLVTYIDSTEQLIATVDNLIISIGDLLDNFTSVVQEAINVRSVESHVKLSRYIRNRTIQETLVKPVILPDFEIMSKLFGMSEDKLKERYMRI